MATKRPVTISTTINVQKGAYNYYLTFTLTQGSSALNLTGATVELKVADFNTPTTVKFTGSCIVTDASNGICKYLVQSSDFDSAGQYKGQLHITYTATGKLIKTDSIKIYVQEGVG